VKSRDEAIVALAQKYHLTEYSKGVFFFFFFFFCLKILIFLFCVLAPISDSDAAAFPRIIDELLQSTTEQGERAIVIHNLCYCFLLFDCLCCRMLHAMKKAMQPKH